MSNNDRAWTRRRAPPPRTCSRAETLLFGAMGFCSAPFQRTISLAAGYIDCEEGMNTRNALRAVNEGALRVLIDRLRRNELDFDQRLAERLQTVADPSMPTTDPLYQRLYYTRRGLDVQRAEAERELARRASPS